MTLKGTIAGIRYISTPSEKAVLELDIGPRDKIFAEFRGKRSSMLTKFATGDLVQIEVQFEGRKNPETQRHHNNIVGRQINHVHPS